MSDSIVPNLFPTVSSDYRLAIVGEAPGNYEAQAGLPFVGPSGNLLNGALQAMGIMRSACFIGNVCQHQPPYNDIEQYDKSGPEIQQGLQILKSDLNKFQPNCILLLGATALWAAGSFHKVNTYRGTIFHSDTLRSKCVATYHPAYILRMWDDAPLFEFDVRRAVEESYFKDLRLPQRTIDTKLTVSEILSKLRAIQPGTLVSIDIEGGVPNESANLVERKNRNGITCISVSTDPSYAFVIPLQDLSDENAAVVMKEFARVMADYTIPKVLQNSLYDYTALAWVWKLPINNIAHDTMLSGWEIFPELSKGLGVQASIWTKEPYYKFERTAGAELPEAERKQIHYNYNGKDAAVTLEICQNHQKAFTPTQRDHYNFNVKLLRPLQYMSLRGIRYDKEGSDRRREELLSTQYAYQTACNTFAGTEINLNSPKQMTELLYRKLGMEPQYKIEKGRKTNKLTADAGALLTLIVKGGNEPHPFLYNALMWRKLDGERKQLEIDLDSDGRVRCSYNLVGADTGRLSCSGSITGSGTNLQTIMEANRRFYLADPDHYFFQCDLSGADGWTVAAHCASLGDPTMIDDYYAGLKPAKIVALMHLQREGKLPDVLKDINSLTRQELKHLCKTIPLPSDIYAICKVVQHGCYTENHEVLTPSGWIPIAQATIETPVLSFNPENNTSYFTLPQRTVKFDYQGNLHKFVGTAIDLEVTHDHKMLLETNGTYKELTAEQVSARKAGILPYTSNYISGDSNVSEARLVAAIHSDGCFTERGYIVFHFVKQRKVERLTELLLGLNVPHTCHKGSDGTFHFSITDKEWCTRLQQHNKVASAQMLGWNQESLSAYIDEYPHWDGSFGPTGSISIMSANKDHLDWITTFASLTGRGYTIQAPQVSGFGTLIYRLNLNNRRGADLGSLKEKSSTPASTKVYCLTVDTGFLIIRRNGKICISGNSNYQMGPNRMSENLLEKSFKKSEDSLILYVPPRDCKVIQALYFKRYSGIHHWHRWVEEQLRRGNTLPSASGHIRTFFGRPNDAQTLKAALAQEPQHNTTYATNLAMLNLWEARDNRRANGTLKVAPLHSVHDALCGQFRIVDTEWAVEKINQWFNNRLNIGNDKIVIPYEGGYGHNWYQTKEGNRIGEI